MSSSETPSRNELVENAVSRSSSPSNLRITDMRMAVVASNYDYPIIRIDTNQGLYGIGEVRDAGHATNALQFKSMLVGQNPCNIDMIHRTIKQYGNWGREGGGVSGIEIALMDLVGKAYGVPCHQFLGGKYRDRVRIYGDTPTPDNPTKDEFVAAVMRRAALGLTWIKFDLRPSLFEHDATNLIGHNARYDYQYEPALPFKAPGAGRGAKLTRRNIEATAEVVRAVREAVGTDIQLSVDHFGEGFLMADEVIRLGRALEPYDLAWMEDPLLRLDVAGHRRVADALEIPIAAGEDIFSREVFASIIAERAFDILHPDLLSAGGMLETKKISDDGEAQGLPTALHFAGSPIGFMANIHTAASISSFLALEHHGLDLPFWTSLVTGLDEGYLSDGYVKVPDLPGLGVDLNYDAIEANLRTPGTMFQPTDEWNDPKLGFWQPDDRWPS